MHHSCASSSKAPMEDVPGAHESASALLDLLLQMKGKKSSLQPQPATTGRATVVVVAAACLAGTALLTWWALRFHPSYAQLWMVPVGLVLACTPVVVCVALFFSPAADVDAPLSAVA
jgi:hypothetical protein